MNCGEAKRLWESEPLESLDERRRTELHDHASDCGGCRREVDLLELIRTALPETAEPYRLPSRNRFLAPFAGAVAAAFMIAMLVFMLSAPSREELSTRLAAHLSAAEPFCREVENLRGEDPARDSNLVALEWELSSLKTATESLPVGSVQVRLGREAADYVATFRNVGTMIQARRSVAEIRNVLQEGKVSERIAVLKSAHGSTAPPVRISLQADDEVSRFAGARAHYYAGRYREAETLFDLFCQDHPKSVYRSDAAYWGARAAHQGNNPATLLEFASRITEQEWVDEALVRELKGVLGRHDVTISLRSDGAVHVALPSSHGKTYLLSRAVAEKAGLAMEIEEEGRPNRKSD